MDTPRNDDQCNNIQMAYFTKIGIWGRFVMQFFFGAMVVPGFLIMRNRWWSFDDVQYFIMSFVVFSGVIVLALTIKIAVMFRSNEELWGISKFNEYLINSVQRNGSAPAAQSYIDSDG